MEERVSERQSSNFTALQLHHAETTLLSIRRL